MIGFKQNRPLLQHGMCLFAEYGDFWISDALEKAAEKAKVSIPFKSDLVEAVKYYLENFCDLSVLKVEELFKRMRKMLNEVGLSMIASHLSVQIPPVVINVADIAKDWPFWLFFQSALNHKLAVLRQSGITHYSFTDKKACVLALQGCHKWNKRSQNLLDELDFILSRYQPSLIK